MSHPGVIHVNKGTCPEICVGKRVIGYINSSIEVVIDSPTTKENKQIRIHPNMNSERAGGQNAAF